MRNKTVTIIRRAWLVCVLFFWMFTSICRASDDQEAPLLFADGLYARGMYSLALKEYEAFAKKFPDNDKMDTVLFRTAECYRQLDDVKKAERLFGKVFAAYPKSEFRLKAGFRRADIFMKAGQYQAAVELYGRVLKYNPTPDMAAACLYYSADAHIELGEAADAVKTLETIRDKYPGSDFFSYSLLKLGDFYRKGLGESGKGKDEKEAVRMYQMAAEKPASDRVGAEALFQLAEMYFKEKNYEKSADAYGQLLSRYPKDDRAGEAKLQAAWAAHHAGRFADAMSLAEAACKFKDDSAEDPDKRAEWIYLKANCERSLMKHAQAVKTYASLLSQYGSSRFAQPARYECATSYYRMGRFQQAVDEAEKINLTNDVKKDVYWLLAESYQALKNRDKAIQYYQLLVKNFPECDVAADATYRLAYQLQERKDYAEASRYYGLVATRFPKDRCAPKALFASAFCLAKAGRPEEAVRDWAHLVQNYPTDPLVEEALYQKAMTETKLDRADEAMASLRDFVKRFPKSSHLSDVHYWSGMHLKKSGKDEDAIKEFRNALASGPRKDLAREAEFRLALLLKSEDDLEEAAKRLQGLLSTPYRSKLSPELLEWLASYQCGKKRCQEAIQSATILEGMDDPLWKQAGFSLSGRAYLAKGDTDKAQASFEKALNLRVTGPYAPESGLRLGEILLKKGKHVEAENRFKQAVDWSGEESERSIRAHAYMGLARAVRMGGNEKEAARYFMIVAILFEDDELVPEALFEACRSLSAAGELEEATKTKKELIKRYPSSTWAKKVSVDE